MYIASYLAFHFYNSSQEHNHKSTKQYDQNCHNCQWNVFTHKAFYCTINVPSLYVHKGVIMLYIHMWLDTKYTIYVVGSF